MNMDFLVFALPLKIRDITLELFFSLLISLLKKLLSFNLRRQPSFQLVYFRLNLFKFILLKLIFLPLLKLFQDCFLIEL